MNLTCFFPTTFTVELYDEGGGVVVAAFFVCVFCRTAPSSTKRAAWALYLWLSLMESL